MTAHACPDCGASPTAASAPCPRCAAFQTAATRLGAPVESTARSEAHTALPPPIARRDGGAVAANAPPEVEAARADPRRRFGRFVVLSELGKGGMGVVYKAWDDVLQRLVALKLIRTDGAAGASDAATLERFRREAQAAGRLRHPSIVAVHDVGETQGRPYIAMDFIDGTTLDRVLPPLDGMEKSALEKAIAVVRDVARAVEHAHEQGVIHRDLKPQNVLVDRRGRAYVLDFGLAKLRDAAGGATRTGTAIGTPAYMPPEQAGGDPSAIDERSDVYSLGATLYHVLAGRPPFEGPSEINVLTLVITRDPEPPSRTNRRALGDLDTLCLKCLDKDPDRRYARAGELADELDRWLAGDPILARPLGRVGRALRWGRRNARLLAPVAFAGLVALSALGWAIARPRIEEARRAAGRARVRSAVEERADAIATAVGGRLEALRRRIGTRPTALELAAIASSLAETARPVEAEAPLRQDLARAGEAAGAALDDPRERREAVASAVDATLERRLRWRALAASLALEQARVHEVLGNRGAATALRAHAYRVDPSGPDGASGFLALGEELISREDWPRALSLLRTLSSRRVPPAILSSATLGAAHAALAVGEPAAARDFASRALATGSLDGVGAARARWVERVAAAVEGRVALHLPYVRGLVVLRPPGGERTVVALVAEPRSGMTLRAYRLDASARALREVARTPVGHAGTIVAARTPAGEGVAVATGLGSTATGVEMWRVEGERFVNDEAWTLPGVEGGQLLAAGSLGDARRDALVLDRLVPGGGGTRSVVVARRDESGACRVEPVPLGKYASFIHTAAIADLDGDGENELLVHLSGWQPVTGYRIFAFRLEGDRVVRVGRGALVGETRGPLIVGRRGQRSVVLATGERAHPYDTAFRDDLGLHPELPDALWSVVLRDGQPALEGPLLARPLEERDRWILAGATPVLGAIAGHPESFAVREVDDGEQVARLAFVRAPGETPVRVLVPPRTPTVLLPLESPDEPGAHHLVGYDGIDLVAFGFPTGDARDTVPASAAVEPTRLDVGLDLLACGLTDEAALALEAVASDAREEPLLRREARAALARARAASGDLAGARRAALESAAAEPRDAVAALLAASGYAEEGGAIDAALEDLERARRLASLTAAERAEVDRRRRRLAPFRALGPSLALDATSGARELGATVEHPLLVRRSPGRILLRTQRTRNENLASRPQGAVSVPVRFDGTSFQLSARLRVRQMTYPSWVTIYLETGGSRACGFSVQCAGGGDADAWQREIRVEGPDRDGPVVVSVEEFPASWIDLELRYVASELAITGTVVVDGVARRGSLPLERPLVAGAGNLVVTDGWFEHRGTATEVELDRVVVSGTTDRDPAIALVSPGAATTDGARLARARASFALDEPARALELLAPLAQSSERAVRDEARFLRALALVRAGRADEGVEALVALRAESPSVDALWRYDAGALPDAELDALVRAVARGRAPTDGNATPGELLVGLLALPASRRDPTRLAWAHAQCGRIGAALELVERSGCDDANVLLAIGQAALDAGEYERAAALLSRVPGAGAESSRRRAERLARGAR